MFIYIKRFKLSESQCKKTKSIFDQIMSKTRDIDNFELRLSNIEKRIAVELEIQKSCTEFTEKSLFDGELRLSKTIQQNLTSDEQFVSYAIKQISNELTNLINTQLPPLLLLLPQSNMQLEENATAAAAASKSQKPSKKK